MAFIYHFVANYGVALILFTVLIKLVLLPLSIKQQKSMVKLQQVQPRMAEIQEKYKNDQQRQQAEMMKLYKEHKISPMGGCLPMLLQFPVLICLYQVISYPLTYMFRMNASESWALVTQYGYDAALRANEITPSVAQIQAATDAGLINFDFLGGLLNLAQTPHITQPSLLWAIPILAALTTFLSSKVMTMMQGKKKDEAPKKPQRVLNPEAKNQGGVDQAQSMNKTMMYFMPIMTLWITFSYPAALGFYWLISNILSVFQQMYLNHKYGSKYKEEVMAIEERKEMERKERKKLKKKKK